jgi:hypothetical protein
MVDICHQHNLVQADTDDGERRYGIRVTLPPGDTFSTLLGADWERIHWYATAQTRDTAFDDMAQRHGYYRKTDSPTQILEKILR